jgi:hypothetical protein
VDRPAAPENMRREECVEFVKILEAHQRTLDVCEACAITTRDLAGEVARAGSPPREHLLRTIEEAERVLAELTAVREEVRRLLAAWQ